MWSTKHVSQRKSFQNLPNVKMNHYNPTSKITQRKDTKFRLINENKFLYKKKNFLNLKIYYVDNENVW